MKGTQILNSKQISQKLNRIAYQIYEQNLTEKEVILAGIEGNGQKMAKKISEILKKISPLSIHLGKISINKSNPIGTHPVIDIPAKEYLNRSIILIDDVMNTGRTMAFALKIFLDVPVKKISTAVLVDRSHTLYPIKIDFVGLSLSTTLQEHIDADFSVKGQEKVLLS